MPFPFAGAVSSIAAVLARRAAIVERIESRLLNVKGKDASARRDRPYFESALDACVLGGPGMPSDAAALRARLADALLADGFELMFRDAYAHRLDAAELVVRAYEHWDAHRWPGTSGRLAHAGAIYSAFVLRLLEDLSLRIWDEGDAAAPQHLEDVQRLLDELNSADPAGAVLRDAAWLVQTGQGAITRQLAPYVRIAERIAASFPGEPGVALHAPGAKLAGGHLRSQLRQRATELGRAAGDPAVLVVTRNSNAMDLALLAGDLLPLLEAYAGACRHGERGARRRLADTIVQGLSADPEILLTRLDLLGPCSMLETVFVEAGHASLTAAGTRHARILDRYRELIAGAAAALAEDASALQAEPGYSPFALVYGFCADLLSRMASDSLRGSAMRGFTVEDLFESGGSDGIRQRVEAWRIDYSPAWASQNLADVVRALEQRAAHPGRANASDTTGAALRFDAPDAGAAGRGQEYCVTSDVQLALSTGATAFPRSQFVMDRNEGRFLASAEVHGKWFGISKAVLTERIAQGQDVVLTGVPQNVKEILQLTCPNLVR